jgi:putative transposase
MIPRPLTDGRRFRVLTVIDDCTRVCLALIADTSLSGARIARELTTLFDARGKPMTVVSDRRRSGKRSGGSFS